MANSVDSDQTAPIGAVSSGSMLFANLSVMLFNYLQQTTFSDAFFFLALLELTICILMDFPIHIMSLIQYVWDCTLCTLWVHR